MSRGLGEFWTLCDVSLDVVPLTWATPHIFSGRLFDKVSLSANKSLNSRNLSTPTFVTIMLSTGCIPRMMIRRFAHKAIDNATAHSLISILFEKLLHSCHDKFLSLYSTLNTEIYNNLNDRELIESRNITSKQIYNKPTLWASIRAQLVPLLFLVH